MARILLVEDNEMNADMLSRRLERRGHEVQVAEDGERGVELARSNKPDLIVMDVSLPKMDGWTATKLLKGDAETAAIPIVILTAHAMTTDREKAKQVGGDDFDTKPVDFKRLYPKLQAQLDRVGAS